MTKRLPNPNSFPVRITYTKGKKPKPRQQWLTPCLDCGAKRWVDATHYKAGQQKRCIKCANLFIKRGSAGYKEKGGYVYITRGYVSPEDWPLFDAMRNATSDIKRSRFVMAKHLGRILSRDEWVHHRNGIKTDDRPENLEIIAHAQYGAIKCPYCHKRFGVH